MAGRVFVYDGRQFPDPNAAWTIEQVRDALADQLPDLANATHKESKGDGNTTIIEFQKRVGTKGEGTAL